MKLRKTQTKLAIALGLAAGSMAAIAGASPTIVTVAYTGRADLWGPNLGASAFSDLSGTAFSLTPDGDVIFRGALDGSNTGVWLWNGAGNTALAKTGDSSPAGGAFLNSFNQPLRNASGQWTFREGASGSAKIFADHGSGLSLIARGTDPVPGLPGVTYSSIGTVSPNLSGMGHIAFPISMTGAGVVTSGATANNSGVVITNPSGVASVALRQNDETGITDVRVGLITGTSLPLVMNDSGRYLALTNLQGAAVTAGAGAGNDQALFTNRSGSLEMVARRGSPAPGALDGANYRVISTPAINNAGQISFISTLRDGSIPAATTSLNALFTDAYGPLTMIARGGTPIPASTGFASHTWGNSIADVVLTSSGRMAFRNGGIAGPGITANVNDSVVITTDTAGVMTTVVQQGTQAVGLAPGINYGSIGSGLRMNDVGQVAFTTNLSGPGVFGGPGGNNSALFATDPDGVLDLIVRRGDQFEAAPGDMRQIESIALLGSSAGEDGRSLSFNNTGDLVFALTFTNGSSGIYVAYIPTAGAIGLAGLGTLVLVAQRRRLA